MSSLAARFRPAKFREFGPRGLPYTGDLPTLEILQIFAISSFD
jgi:hypothetical protein